MPNPQLTAAPAEAYKPSNARRNQVNLHLTDEEMQVLLKRSLDTELRVGQLARMMLSKAIAKGAQL